MDAVGVTAGEVDDVRMTGAAGLILIAGFVATALPEGSEESVGLLLLALSAGLLSA